MQGTLHFNEGWQEQTDVYVGYVMVVKFQVHRKQAWMRTGSFRASFKVFQRSQWYPNQKNPSESQRELLECSFLGPGPSSLTRDFWGSGDGSCYFRDHCLGTTDGQPLPPLTKYLRTSSTAWTIAHSLDYFPLSQAPLTSFCPVFTSLALIGNCRMEMEGF